MKTNDVLTMEQQDFAAQNHDLVYAFLDDNRLKEDDFYDVVIFGYLRAVRKYFGRTELREYAFSTIAWRAMKCEVGNHFQKKSRQCRNAYMVSLDALGADHPALSDVYMDEDRIVEIMEASTLWNKVAESLSEEQTDILQLAADGYTPREIASIWKRPLKNIEELFSGALSVARASCAV